MEESKGSSGQAFWREQYERWQGSEKSKAAFCREASLSVERFYYWSRRFEGSGSAPRGGLSSAFLPVSLMGGAVSSFSLQVGEVTISSDQPVSGRQLREWLVAIRSVR